MTDFGYKRAFKFVHVHIIGIMTTRGDYKTFTSNYGALVTNLMLEDYFKQ